MQMWRVREWKRARRISRTINFARARAYNSARQRREGRSPHTANENFAGAVVNFITVATFYPVYASRPLLLRFFVSVSYLRETRRNVGGKEDDENYVVTPGSSCQRSSAQRPRDIRTRGGCGNVFVYAAYTYTLTWQNGGKEESTEGEHTELKPYKRAALRAGKRSNYILV